jgi:hypothetical protein
MADMAGKTWPMAGICNILDMYADMACVRPGLCFILCSFVCYILGLLQCDHHGKK